MYTLLTLLIGFMLVIAFVYIRYLYLLYSIPTQIEKAKGLFENDPKKASEILTSILSVDKGNPLANWLMAHFHMKHKRYILALMFLNEIINFARFTPEVSEQDVRETMSQLYINLGNMEKALAQFAILQEKYELPGSLIKKAVAILLESGNIQDAKSILESSSTKHLNNGEFDYILATILFKEKQYSKAETKLETALSKNYTEPDLYYLLGKILFLMEKKGKALEAFLLSNGADCDQYEQANLIGQLYYDKKDYQATISTLENSLSTISSKNPNYSGSCFFLGLALEKEGQIDTAIELWTNVQSKYTHYNDAQEKIKFYNEVAKKPYERKLLGLPIDNLVNISCALAEKMDYEVKDIIRKNRTSIELSAISKKDTMFSSMFYFVVNRSITPLSEKDLKDIIIRKNINKCKFITIVGFLFTDDAKLFARQNSLEIHTFQLFKKHRLI